MKKIELQKKTTAKNGKIEIYYFENENIGLKKTLFHRIYIPIEPFDSGLEYESQPLETEIVMEWLNLKLKNPTELAGLKLSSNPEDEIEVSIYVGSAHNPCDIKEMEFQKTGDNKYKVKCSLLVDFEHEGVAENEEYNFNAELNLDKEIKE
jgi:hypothetical protein